MLYYEQKIKNLAEYVLINSHGKFMMRQMVVKIYYMFNAEFDLYIIFLLKYFKS